MPVSVIVGGQFGSEGKGKVSAHVSNEMSAAAIIRVGGPNSGHTSVDNNGQSWTFRQLPAGLAGRRAIAVLPAGSLIDVELLLLEVERFGLPDDCLWIDPKASIVTDGHKRAEQELIKSIGSTASGTGASLLERIGRNATHVRAANVPELREFIQEDLSSRLRSMLRAGDRIVVEGTQGFGLSVWHSDHFPFATSRDTSAATFVAEAGLAPHDVDDTVMVLRSFPIRVGGNSGPLPYEIDWPTLANEAQLPPDYRELTSATGRVRRVARFDPGLVRRALEVNAPHRVVLNHMDYVDPEWGADGPTAKSRAFLADVERSIGRYVDLIGYGPATLLTRAEALAARVA